MKERIQKIMSNYGMNAGQFADELGLSPANISHIISGRNNPSLDVVQRIADKFPNVNILWLLKGEGSMLKNNNSTQDVETPTIESNKKTVDSRPVPDNDRKIERIMIFFSDGTYKEIH